MTQNKTQPTDVDAHAYLAAVPDGVRRADAHALAALLSRLSGEPPVMWGPSIVGFGSYWYSSGKGQENRMCRIGFSPRTAELVLYFVGGFTRHAKTLAALGKHRTGSACLYIRRLADVDMQQLEVMIRDELAHMDAHFPRH